jgi:hypothetical protein
MSDATTERFAAVALFQKYEMLQQTETTDMIGPA